MNALDQLNRLIVIADDIMIVDKQQNHRDHDVVLTTLLDTARKCNVTLNFDKLQYKKTEVEFFGETYTIDGHKPAQSKLSAITEMPAPTCKTQVQSLIGMINYLSKFSVRLSLLAEPIIELVNYNPRKQTVLQTDASMKSLGTCLMPDERPVYFASKALTEEQKVYVAIEIESLAAAWAVEKFHHFLYASHFILERDQKPLEVILSKSLNQATPSLQRILIRTFPYHFTVCYIPGATN